MVAGLNMSVAHSITAPKLGDRCKNIFGSALITLLLFNRVLGVDDAPLGAVMGKRGDAGVAVGTATTGADSSSSGVTTVAAVASEMPSRCARAVRERAGASPRARSAARRTGRST